MYFINSSLQKNTIYVVESCNLYCVTNQGWQVERLQRVLLLHIYIQGYSLKCTERYCIFKKVWRLQKRCPLDAELFHFIDTLEKYFRKTTRQPSLLSSCLFECFRTLQRISSYICIYVFLAGLGSRRRVFVALWSRSRLKNKQETEPAPQPCENIKSIRKLCFSYSFLSKIVSFYD